MAERRLAAKPDLSWMKETTFNFKVGEEPEGFRDLDIGEEVTVTLKGKVHTFTKTDSPETYASSSFTLKRSSMEIRRADGRATLNETLEKTRERRRR